MATVVDERALDERLARLETARSWSPRVVSRLEALIREGDDAALFRVNPFTLAGQRDLAPRRRSTCCCTRRAQGLFEMDWLLVCPRCACAVESFARLRAVLRRFRCPECRNEYEAAMDDYIAVYFTVSPRIRAIRHHRPETLDPFDYMYLFKGVREARMPARRAVHRGVARRPARHRLPGAGRHGQLRLHGGARGDRRGERGHRGGLPPARSGTTRRRRGGCA